MLQRNTGKKDKHRTSARVMNAYRTVYWMGCLFTDQLLPELSDNA